LLLLPPLPLLLLLLLLLLPFLLFTCSHPLLALMPLLLPPLLRSSVLLATPLSRVLPLHSRPLRLCTLPNPLPVMRCPSCTCSTCVTIIFCISRPSRFANSSPIYFVSENALVGVAHAC
jgi:hypothetical protein